MGEKLPWTGLKIFEHRGAVDSLHQNVAISKVFWAKIKHRWNSDSLTGNEPHHADLISGVLARSSVAAQHLTVADVVHVS
jgi:hypothetical protein